MRYIIGLALIASGCAQTNAVHVHPFAYSAGYETGVAIVAVVEAESDTVAARYVEIGLDGYVEGLSDALGVSVDPCEEGE